MHVYVAIIFIKRQHDPPIWMITDHRHCTNSLANNRNKLYTCHIGHVCNWCNSECVAWWVILSVKVFECLTLKFLPRSKEDHRATVACSVSHSNNGDQVSVVLPVIFLLLPASVSYQFFSPSLSMTPVSSRFNMKWYLALYYSSADRFRIVPAQDVHFFYTRSHLSAIQKCALIFLNQFSVYFHI